MQAHSALPAFSQKAPSPFRQSVCCAVLWACACATAHELATVEVTGHYDNAIGTSEAASQGVVGPDLLQNLLEVRGIGLLDIRAIFGETAVRRKMRLKLIVHLVRRETLERDYERLPHEPLTQDVLGIPVRKVVIQVVAGRNIAVLVEAAVRNTILQLRGINT